MRTKAFWINAEEDYLECVTHKTRIEADEHAVHMHEKYPNERLRTACLKLVVTWEDGQGLDSQPIHIEGSVEDE